MRLWSRERERGVGPWAQRERPALALACRRRYRPDHHRSMQPYTDQPHPLLLTQVVEVLAEAEVARALHRPGIVAELVPNSGGGGDDSTLLVGACCCGRGPPVVLACLRERRSRRPPPCPPRPSQRINTCNHQKESGARAHGRDAVVGPGVVVAHNGGHLRLDGGARRQRRRRHNIDLRAVLGVLLHRRRCCGQDHRSAAAAPAGGARSGRGDRSGGPPAGVRRCCRAQRCRARTATAAASGA